MRPTDNATLYHLGGRDPDSFADAGILPCFAGVAVHDRYANYFHPVGLEYRIVGLICRFMGARVDHAAMWYSLVSPSRIGLRRTWWPARLITCGGWVSAWAGVSCASAWCGRAALKWCR